MSNDKLAEALRTLEAAAINGVVLHGDDIPRLHATVNRIAPLTAEAVQAQLQPEVREAMEVIAGEAVCTCHVAYTSRGMKDPGCNHDLAEYVDTVRAELLRLTRENDEWQTRCLRFQTERDMARAELAALKARVEWQPIETAPVEHDVLTCAPTIFPWDIECKHADGKWERDNPQPTHWMPLPPPPKGKD